MSTIVLRGAVEVGNPLELALEFLAAYSSYESHDFSGPGSFDETDLRLANRGGARISTAEITAILERRDTNETWIATARSCARSGKSSRAASTGSPRCESSTS